MLNSYWRMLSGLRYRTLLGVLTLGAGGALEALSLLLLGLVLSALLGGLPPARLGNYLSTLFGDENRLVAALLIFAVCGAGASAVKFAGEWLILDIRNRVEKQAGTAMASALLAVAWEPFASLRQGDIAKSLLIEGNQMAFGVRQLLNGLGIALAALPLLVAACVMSLEMTLYTLAFGAMAAFLFRLASTPVRNHVTRLSNSIATLSVRITDVFGNLKFLRSTGLSQQAKEDAGKAYEAYAKAYFDSQIYPTAMRYVVEGGAVIFIAIFLYWQIVIERRPTTTVLVFLAIFYRLVPKLMAAQEFLFQAGTYLPWYESWEKRMDFCHVHRQAHAGTKGPELGQGLAFHHVSFGFSSGEPLLQDMDFVVPPGRCVAVVGPSGSGKTTLLDLATGLLQPTSGYLSLGAQSVDEMDLRQWQRKIGLVSQDCPIFFASILDNIAWGEKNPDRDLAIRCAHQAHAWEFIERLPQGIDTLIGERGANLSGGQRQRLGIARALYRKPWLLILDEATSALDSVTEQAIQEALSELKGHLAMLLVAHRLKTVAMADEILVIEQGKIAERGSWEQLVARQGAFHDLLKHQRLEER